MNYQFNVQMSEQDYIEYNQFVMMRSPYGKKQVKNVRISLTLIFATAILASLLIGGFNIGFFTSLIPLLILYFISQVFLVKFSSYAVKRSIKDMKKQGKMAYSTESVLKFFDDCFVEITPDNKTETNYSAVERISIVDNKMIYIHVNNVMAYILPISCFESTEQYNSFMDFIKTKCSDIDVY